jgi:hypothetical protein
MQKRSTIATLKAFFFVLVMIVGVRGWGQVSITTLGSAYTQNFDGLGSSSATWTDNSTLGGWYISTATLPISTGTTSSGTCVNVGIAGTNPLTDRALGCLQSGGTNQRFGLRMKNNSGSAITSFSIAFTGEQWRSFAAGTLVFEYQTAVILSSLTAGSWTAATAFDFAALKITGTGGALDGNDPTNRTAISNTLTVTVASGSEIFFRWTRNTNSSPILAVDDLSITPNGAAGSTPPSLSPAAGATVDAPFDVTFTDDATWRGQIASITFDGATVNSSAYDKTQPGKITFTPSLSTALQTAKTSKNIVITATGYTSASVAQTIGAGAANKLAMNTQPTAPGTNGGALAIQPKVNIVDQYGNLTNSTASITAAVGAGSWTLGGTTSVAAVGGTTTFSGLTATSAAAVSGATIAFSSAGLTGIPSSTFNIPGPAPVNDLCSNAVTLLVNGSTVAGTLSGATNSNTFTNSANKNDVWYKFIPSITGSHSITMNWSAGPDIDMYIFTSATCPTSGAASFSAATGNNPEVYTGSFTAGTNYFIRVTDFNGDAAAFTIGITGPCTPPSIQASALTTSAPNTTQFTSSWTAGNGDGTMIVIRPTAQLLTAPSNGTAYTPNADYTSAGQINPNNRVIFRAAGTTVTPSGLTPGIQYTVTAYEYNNTSNCYNLTSPLSASTYTLSNEPTAHAAAFTATPTGPNTIDLGFSAASSISNAAGYIVLQRSGLSAPTGVPADATGYIVGNTIGDGTVAAIITSTSATAVTISGLTGNADYSFTLIPYNWNVSIAATYNYYTDATIPSASATTTNVIAPTVISPTATAITNTTATLGGNVTSDGGDPVTTRGVVWAETSLNSDPAIGGANTTNINTGGAGTGVFTVSATSLPEGTQISYKAYAINGIGTSYTSPVSTFTTLAAQPSSATLMTFSNTTVNSIQVNWTNGTGANRIVVARLSATARVAPTNGVGYNVNSTSFADNLNGTTGTGNVVVYNGTGSTVNVTGLTGGNTYVFDVYEYNGSGATANYGAALSGSKSTLAIEPSVQASNVTFTNVNNTGFTINWTKGSDAANSLVIIKAGSAVDSDPVDGTSYTATAASPFGAQIGTGNFVVYRASLATITVTGLTAGQTYHVAVYSYNGSAGGTPENYLTSSPATGSQVAQTPTYYSQTSGDPAALSNWNSVRGGGGSTPGSFSGIFVIQNTHNLTTTGTWSFGGTGSTLQIESGGTLTANNAITIASGATFQIDNGGSYIHNNTGTPSTTIFNGTESFGGTSNIRIDNWVSNTTVLTTGVTLPFGNLEINWTGNTSNWQNSWSGTISLCAGNLKITSVGSGSLRFSGGSAYEITIGGDLIIDGGSTTFASTTSDASVRNIYVGGSFNQSGGTLTSGSGSNTNINFTGLNKSFIQSGGTLTNTNLNWVIASGASITINNNLPVASSRTVTINGTLITGTNSVSGAGTVTVNNGGTLQVGSLSASGAISANVTASGGLTLNTGSTVEYNGLGAQFASARTFSNVKINNNNGVTANGNLTVSGELNLALGNLAINGTTLALNGTVTGTGLLKGSAASNLTSASAGTLGTLSFDQTTDGTTNALNNLTLSSGASATLGNKLNLYGTLTAAGTFNAATQSLVLKASSATSMARVANITGALNNADNVTVERMIPMGKRAYRQLAPGVNSTGNIRANWQNGGVYAAGVGMHITGSTSGANGFDATQTGAASMYTYTAGAVNFTAIPGTDGTNKLDALRGYRVFVIGDRNADLTIPNNTGTGTPNINLNAATTLKATGTLVTGKVEYNNAGVSVNDVLADASNSLSTTNGDYALIANPYWSPVNWDAMTKSNVATTYYIWDPAIGNRGAYVSWTTGTGSNNGLSAMNNHIQPGQAIFVQSTGATPSITFNEANKSTGFTNTFRTINETPSKVRVYLKANNAQVQDGTTVAFRDDFNNAVGAEDAEKFTNSDENIAIVRGSSVLGVEGRTTVVAAADTVPLRLWRLFTNNTYSLKLDGSDFDAGITGYLLDRKYNQQYPLDLNGSIEVPFAFTANDSSSFYDRFMLVFRTATVLPVSFTSVKAYKKNTAIQVEWNTATETNTRQYEVERSGDGRLFSKMGTVAAKASNSNGSAYDLLDANPLTGSNYYRVKAVGNSGVIGYSAVVRVNMNGLYVNSSIYPNPVKGSKFDWKLEGLEKGSYTIRLYNQLGQTLYRKLFTSQGGSLSETIELNESLAPGVYTLVLQNSFGTQRQQQLSIQN